MSGPNIPKSPRNKADPALNHSTPASPKEKPTQITIFDDYSLTQQSIDKSNLPDFTDTSKYGPVSHITLTNTFATASPYSNTSTEIDSNTQISNEPQVENPEGTQNKNESVHLTPEVSSSWSYSDYLPKFHKPVSSIVHAATHARNTVVYTGKNVKQVATSIASASSNYVADSINTLSTLANQYGLLNNKSKLSPINETTKDQFLNNHIDNLKSSKYDIHKMQNINFMVLSNSLDLENIFAKGGVNSVFKASVLNASGIEDEKILKEECSATTTINRSLEALDEEKTAAGITLGIDTINSRVIARNIIYTDINKLFYKSTVGTLECKAAIAPNSEASMYLVMDLAKGYDIQSGQKTRVRLSGEHADEIDKLYDAYAASTLEKGLAQIIRNESNSLVTPENTPEDDYLYIMREFIKNMDDHEGFANIEYKASTGFEFDLIEKPTFPQDHSSAGYALRTQLEAIHLTDIITCSSDVNCINYIFDLDANIPSVKAIDRDAIIFETVRAQAQSVYNHITSYVNSQQVLQLKKRNKIDPNWNSFIDKVIEIQDPEVAIEHLSQYPSEYSDCFYHCLLQSIVNDTSPNKHFEFSQLPTYVTEKTYQSFTDIGNYEAQIRDIFSRTSMDSEVHSEPTVRMARLVVNHINEMTERFSINDCVYYKKPNTDITKETRRNSYYKRFEELHADRQRKFDIIKQKDTIKV